MSKILFCTVGGSYQPIVAAIKYCEADKVVFICSEDDAATGKLGSYEQITKKGNCIKKFFKSEKAELPNIPTQLGLDQDQYEVLKVPMDDLEGCVQRIDEKIAMACEHYDVVADYTGGTKTMSAALAMVAVNDPKAKLHLVVGRRADLVQVRDGSEESVVVPVLNLRLRRNIVSYSRFWHSYAYVQAEEGFQKLLHGLSDSKLKGELILLRDMSKAFSAWHRFQHQEAFEILNDYMAKHSMILHPYIQSIKILADEAHIKRTPLLILDLLNNAQRRKKQGLFDEYTAISYRIWEWTAQWLLEQYCDIKTADIHENQLPEGIELSKNAKGKYQAGLFQSWKILAVKRPDSVAGIFFQQEEHRFRDIVLIRNDSILAHGFTPISQEKADEVSQWMDEKFVPMLEQECKELKVNTPKQLPHSIEGFIS